MSLISSDYERKSAFLSGVSLSTLLSVRLVCQRERDTGQASETWLKSERLSKESERDSKSETRLSLSLSLSFSCYHFLWIQTHPHTCVRQFKCVSS